MCICIDVRQFTTVTADDSRIPGEAIQISYNGVFPIEVFNSWVLKKCHTCR